MKIIIRRFLAAIIDFYITIILSMLGVLLITLGKLDISRVSVISYLLLVFAFTSMKDFTFGNASVGKKVLKLKLIKSNQTKLSFFDALKRAVPLLLLPLEIFLIVINNRRLGDVWAKTTVVKM